METTNPIFEPGQENSGSTPTPKKSKNVLLIAALVVVVMMLFSAGGVYAYFTYFPPPTLVLQRMLARAGNNKTVQYSGQVSGEISTPSLPTFGGFGVPAVGSSAEKKVQRVAGTFSGKMDFTDLQNPKSALIINATADAGSSTLSFGFESRNIGQVAYVSFTTLPDLGFLDLSGLKNKWIKIDSEALRNKFALPSLKNLTPSTTAKITPEQLNKLKDAFIKSKALKISKDLGSETIDGVNTFHYKLSIDTNGFIKFIDEAGKILSLANTPILPTKPDPDFDKKLAEFKFPELDIWIGKKDYLTRKILFHQTIGQLSSPYSGDIRLTMFMKDFNQPVQIEAPADAKPIEEIFADLLGSMGGGLNFGTSTLSTSTFYRDSGLQRDYSRESVDPNLDSDHDNLPDRLEAVYGTDPHNPDTDGDGFKDGDEVAKGFNPNGPGKLHFKFSTSTGAF